MFRKKRKVRIRGIVRKVSYRRESIQEGFLAAQKRALLSGPRSPAPQMQVLNFRLETTDKFQYKFPFISVELAGKNFRGIVQEGDEVLVEGELTRDNVVEAKRVQSMLTGEKIYMK